MPRSSLFWLVLLLLLTACNQESIPSVATPSGFLSATPLPAEPTLTGAVDRSFSPDAGQSLEEALAEAQETVDFPLLVPAELDSFLWRSLRVHGTRTSAQPGTGFLVELEAAGGAGEQAPRVTITQTTRGEAASQSSAGVGEEIQVQEVGGRLLRTDSGTEITWQNYGVRYSVQGDPGIPSEDLVRIANSMEPLGQGDK